MRVVDDGSVSWAGLLAALGVLAACCPCEDVKPPVAPAAAAPVVTAAPVAVVPVASPSAGPPVARMDDTVDHEFGLSVADPYRWMEGLENAEYQTWLKAQGDYTKGELAKLPGREARFQRLRELGLGVAGISNVQIARGRTIYTTLPAGAQLAKLATLDGKSERILLDPEKLGSGDRHASLNAYSLSPDGKYVGYVIALGGGEQGEIHIMEIATGKELADTEPRIWGEFAPSWLPDGKGFFYTQMVPAAAGHDPMLDMVARYHVLGQPSDKDVTVIGRAADTTFPMTPQEFPGVRIDPSSPWVIVQAGGAAPEQHVAIARRSELDLSGQGKTPWKLVANLSDGIEGVMPHADRLYLSTYRGAPNRKIISVPLAAPVLANARVEIAELADQNLDGWAAARDGIYLRYDDRGLARLARWAWGGKPTAVPLPSEGWSSDFSTETSRDGATFSVNTWLRPGAYYAYDPKTRQTTPTGLASQSKFLDERVVADEVEVDSAGGVKVPLSILHFKDLARDGSHPTILAGYAAYGISQHAGFSATRLEWLERGGVLAVCHARGGSEKGRTWQDDGSRDKKLNGIRDVIACGEYLVAQQYTAPARLAVRGGSAGGILMGRAITERPDLFAAAHIAVGMVNPLRTLAAENGANQIGELGDPRTEAGYKSILAFDPYLNVKPATKYPAVIFTVGLNDHRVAPWMTGKMAARLQASSTSGRPVWIRVETDAGHGIGSTRDQAFAEAADVESFLLRQFGL